VDLDAVELAVRRGAEMVFDVARAADILGVGRAAGEFVEDRAVGLAHDVGEDVEAAAVGHADDDLLDAVLAAIFDHASSAGTIDSPPSRPKRLVPTYLRARNFSHCSASITLARIACLPSGVKVISRLALHPLLEEAALLQVVDVHIFEADHCRSNWRAAPRRARARWPIEAERAAEEDRRSSASPVEAVEFGREVGRQLALGEAERIEIGGEVAAHAVGADQHHRADRILRRLATPRRTCPKPAARRLGFLRDRRSIVISVGSSPVDLVELGQRPVVPRPARALLALARRRSALKSPSSRSIRARHGLLR
jgi:hypothetical protein